MSNGNAREIVEALYNAYMPIYEAWPEKGSEMFAKQLIEHDILMLGSYFGTVDPIGQFAEFNLLAECVAHLRLMDSPIKTDKMLDTWIERVMEEFKYKAEDYTLPVASNAADELISTMRMLVSIRRTFETGHSTFAYACKVHLKLIELANLFVMRDGIVTDKELQAVKQFEASLQQLELTYD